MCASVVICSYAASVQNWTNGVSQKMVLQTKGMSKQLSILIHVVCRNWLKHVLFGTLGLKNQSCCSYFCCYLLVVVLKCNLMFRLCCHRWLWFRRCFSSILFLCTIVSHVSGFTTYFTSCWDAWSINITLIFVLNSGWRALRHVLKWYDFAVWFTHLSLLDRYYAYG